MQVSSIDNCSLNKKQAFKAGKVRVFSDFDKTFLPASHKNFARNYDEGFVNYLRGYFADFKDFLSRTREGLKFSITTGRSYGEFETMAEISRERKFGMPLPDTLIAKNGSDEYLKVGTDEDFYAGGYFPFDYNKTNKEKEENIKRLTGWDGPKIKERLKELFQSYNMRIVEADSEHSPHDYGMRSLFSAGNLPDERGINFVPPNKADWSVGFRKDGNCKIFITYPYDMMKVDERGTAWKEINKKIRNIFEETGVDWLNVHRGGDYHYNNCGGRLVDTYSPIVHRGVEIARYNHNTGLTKHYDVNEAIKIAKQNNDLVIAAGDGSNDEVMLNPFLYLYDDLMKCPEYAMRGYGAGNVGCSVKLMEKYPHLKKAFDDLPFYGIVVKDVDGDSDLAGLITALGSGENKKIIVVEHGHLQDGIKEAIRLYAEKNPKYKEKLSPDLAKEIFGITKKDDVKSQSTSTQPSSEKKNDVWKYILGVFGIAAVGSTILYFVHKNKQKEVKANDTTDKLQLSK